jgi:hypothetical protein
MQLPPLGPEVGGAAAGCGLIAAAAAAAVCGSDEGGSCLVEPVTGCLLGRSRCCFSSCSKHRNPAASAAARSSHGHGIMLLVVGSFAALAAMLCRRIELVLT